MATVDIKRGSDALASTSTLLAPKIRSGVTTSDAFAGALTNKELFSPISQGIQRGGVIKLGELNKLFKEVEASDAAEVKLTKTKLAEFEARQAKVRKGERDVNRVAVGAAALSAGAGILAGAREAKESERVAQLNLDANQRNFVDSMFTRRLALTTNEANRARRIMAEIASIKGQQRPDTSGRQTQQFFTDPTTGASV